MKYRLIYLLSLLFVLSCEDTTPTRDNPLDEEGGDYIAPIVGLLDIVDGDILYSEAVEFTWEGNELVTEYRYKYDSFDWAEWSESTSATLSYLDEGDHQLSVQSRYLNGDTSDVASVSFIVDAVAGPALMFYPRRHFAEQGETVTFQILAEEVTGLMMTEIHLEYDPAMLDIMSISQGSFFQNGQNSLFIYDHETNNSDDLYFDGLDDWVEAPSIDLTNQIFSIETWIKMPEATHSGRTNIIDSYEINSHPNKWGIYVTGTSDPVGVGYINIAEFGVPDFYSSNRIDDNAWHHIALVRNANGNLLLFVDGVLNNGDNIVVLSTNFSTGFTTKIGSGHHPHAGRRYMECSIRDIQVTLDALYDENFSPNENMLTHSEAILHYNFVQGDVVIDLSPYGNNGIFYGGNIGSELDSGAVQINTALLDSDEPSVSGTGDLVEIQVKMLQTGSATISFTGNNVFIGPENNDIIILEKINGLVVTE